MSFRSLFPLAVWALLALANGPVQGAALSATFRNQQLMIQTERYALVWMYGNVIAATNYLNGTNALTLANPAMNTADMPSGVGSFSGLPIKGAAPHSPWGPVLAPFQGQHFPTASSAVTFQSTANGAHLVFSGLSGDSNAVLVQDFALDQATGDLIIQQRCSSSKPGIYGISFNLLNLRPEISLLVPCFGGQRWTRDDKLGEIYSLAWARFWNAGFVIGELPEGGSVIVYADDAQMHPKYFRRYNGTNGVQAIGFEACGEAPYESTTSLTVGNWRFNTFGGNWLAAAREYRSWMTNAYGMTLRSQRADKWTDNLALIYAYSLNTNDMPRLAQLVDPRKVLWQDWGVWPGFNQRLPEYAPSDTNYAAKTKAAHSYGYHVGCYASMLLIDQRTWPNLKQQYGLDYYYYGLSESKPTKVTDWLLSVHPGSSSWRSYYSQKMAQLATKYGFDYFYQDMAGGSLESSGVVGGRNLSQAVLGILNAIRQASPSAALGGEYWTEVIAPSADFGITSFLDWGDETHKAWISSPWKPHPIMSYVFGDFCLNWPHGTVVRDTAKFHRDQTMSEAMGSIPVLTTSSLDDQVSEAHLVLERARLWAQGFRPYFPTNWAPNVVAYLREPGGRMMKYLRDDSGTTFCLEQTSGGDQLRYGRITGREAFTPNAPAYIDGWPGYQGNQLIGLCPTNWYCLFAGAPPASPITITNLPAGAWFSGGRLTNTYCLVQLNGSGSGQVGWRYNADLVLVGTNAAAAAGQSGGQVTLPAALLFVTTNILFNAHTGYLPSNLWQAVTTANGWRVSAGPPVVYTKYAINGQSRDGFMAAPPMGGTNSEYSLDALVRVPSDAATILRFYVGRYGGPGDGRHVVVRVNGQEVWRRFYDTSAGWEQVSVPFASFGGELVLLSLAVDCGPSSYDTSCDAVVWAEPQFTTSTGKPFAPESLRVLNVTP